MNGLTKITFIFTDEPDFEQIARDERFSSSIEVPETLIQLTDAREKVIKIAELTGFVTEANLHVSCPDIGLKTHPIKQNTTHATRGYSLFDAIDISCLYFEGYYGRGKLAKKKFQIYAPLRPPVSGYYNVSSNLRQLSPEYYQKILELSQSLTELLNLNPTLGQWKFLYFHPRQQNNGLVKRINTIRKKRLSEYRKREREEAKRLEREAKPKEPAAAVRPDEIPKSGAGRRPGARPGIYKDVSMRSQLEIRFAAELDERNIRWVYEGEVIGAAVYLVDFYLPDLGVWVEVKGVFEARDRQVLPEVAKYLKQERKHRLLVYMQSKAFVVNPSGFREIERKHFWDELLK